MKLNKAVFLDRDGVINKDLGYVIKKKDFKWLPGVKRALHFLKKKKFKIIIITNQSGIGRGYYKIKDLKYLHNWINDILKKNNTKIDDFYFCPHHPEFGKGKYKTKCKCRKPGNLMILKAKKKWKINTKSSFMIGDKISDKLCAQKSNIKFFYKENNNFYLQIKKIISDF